MDFAHSADHRVKESKNRDKLLCLERKLKKSIDYKSDDNTNCDRRARFIYLRIGTATVGLRNKRTSADHLNYSFVEIDQNTMKNPRDLKILAVTQTPVETINLR